MSDNKDNIVDTEEVIDNTVSEEEISEDKFISYLTDEKGNQLLDTNNQPIPVQLKHMDTYLNTLRFLGEAEGAELTKRLSVAIWHKERSIPDTKGILKLVLTDSILVETYFEGSTSAAKVLIPTSDILGITI